MFRCRDLLSLPTMTRARLIAGEKGLDNGIRWSYKAENMNFAEWVHGQELLIVSTPVINSDDFDLHELIMEAIRLNISGVILLIGEEYISKIPKKTLVTADQQGLPIISLPGAVPLVDIFEELGHAIVYQEKSQLAHDDLLSGIVFGNELDEKALISQAELLGYNIKKKQRIFMIHIDFPENVVAQGFMSNLAAALQKLFLENGSAVLLSSFHFNIIGLTNEYSEEKLNEIFTAFCKLLDEKSYDVKCRIGVGCLYEELSMLVTSFTEASVSVKLASPIQWYRNLGFLKVLLNAENQKMLTEYMEQILGKLIKHDEENNSELMYTLAMYFDCNENMKEVAGHIFIHPNTVKYRLQQVQEICGLNLGITHEKMELYNALLIWKITK